MKEDESNFFDKFKSWFEDFAKSNKPKEEIKPTPPPTVPDYSQLQHNVKAIEDLKNFFTEKLSEKDKVIEETNKKLSEFVAESLKREEERAIKEKAYQEEQEKSRLEQVNKERQSIIDKAIQEGRIAPKDDAFLTTLSDKSIDDVKLIVEKLTPTAESNNNNSNNQSGKQNRPNPSTKLGKGATIDDYLSDLVIN